ncbi:MAG: hydrogenase expression/formation protein HypE [Candidatus Omnitrophica bacterium]|nr:hydrogenase expression/formation protein HypE [Candidatus Omnitrophota bacterium]
MTEFNMSCPRPIQEHSRVLMGHGGGGRLMNQLINEFLLPTLGASPEGGPHDAAVIQVGAQRLAFTTDSYVVQPLFFPGGDIGQLAVHGTVNDLSMAGARPQYLSLALILEEGVEMVTLQKVVQSVAAAAKSSGVQVITGDTKVVDKGKGDQLYINTAGIGIVEHDLTIAPNRVRPGDAVIVNGDLGRHGMAIMAVRAGLEFESEIRSDSAPLWEPVRRLLQAGLDIHCLRDLTRGGLASACNEIAASANIGIRLNEAVIPVREDVRAACEILGLDPLYVANEGRFMCFVPDQQADKALKILNALDENVNAVRIGSVVEDRDQLVTLKSPLGADRIVDMLSGDQLPRIC